MMAWAEKTHPYLQNNQNKKGWRSGSTSRVYVQQEQGPGFKLQYSQRTNMENLGYWVVFNSIGYIEIISK
jgi:hypothetical protein